MVIGALLLVAAIAFCWLGSKEEEASQLYYDLDEWQEERGTKKKGAKATVNVEEQASKIKRSPSKQRQDSSGDAPPDEADTLAQNIYNDTEV